MSNDQAFPLDWNEWECAYNAWTTAHAMRHSRENIQGQNFLADEVMGLYVMNGRTVELSAVTFPNLSERDENGRLIDRKNRFVGITWRGEQGTSVNGGLVSTFDELDAALVAGPPRDL